MATDLAGNSFGSAKDTGTAGAAAKAYSDYVGPDDTADYYKLTANSRFLLNLNFSGVNGSIKATGYRQQGSTYAFVDQFVSGGRSSGGLSGALDSGVYYLKVEPVSGSRSNYNMSFSARPLEAPPEVDVTGLATFGTATQGSTASQVFTVRNTGGATLTTSGMSVPKGFTVTEGLRSTIAGGSFDTFTVQMDTKTVGAKSGQISFRTNDSDEELFTFTVSGTVNAVPTAPEVAVFGNSREVFDDDLSPSSSDHTDFGSATQNGKAVSRTFTVKNTGTGILTTSGLALPTGFTLDPKNGLTSAIASGKSDTFTVLMDTKTAGNKSGQISFNTNDSDEGQFSFAISGTVNSAALPVLGISATSATGPESNKGSVQFTFAVTRSGNIFTTSSVDYGVLGIGGTANANDFVGGLSPSGRISFAIGETSRKITIAVAGDSVAESTETFNVALSNATGAVIGVASTAVGTIKNDDTLASLRDSEKIFASGGGIHSVMADFSLAAYSLQSWENRAINDVNPFADAARIRIFSGWQPLSLNISPSTGIESGQTVLNRYEGGYYTYGNSAALVMRSADAIVISFRGTNDFGGDNPDDKSGAAPDAHDWTQKGQHYANFSNLISSIKGYASANGIAKIYVTGHSLGGAMARAFMDEHKDINYESITFAAPAYGVVNSPDTRITRVEITGDPVPDMGLSSGRTLHFDPKGTLFFSTSAHSMGYYSTIMQNLNPDDWTRLVGLAGNSDLDVLIGGKLTQAKTVTTVTAANGGRFEGKIETPYAISENDVLEGYRVSNEIVWGGKGKDILIGGNFSSDTLFGGAGADTFKFVTFTTPSGSGAATHPTNIADFVSGTDKIQIVKSGFGIPRSSSIMFAYSNISLTTNLSTFIYDRTTGGLYFDSDGKGNNAAVQVATLQNKASLAKTDFQLVG